MVRRITTMKLWILSRTDSVDYDEYDSFVILAKDEAEARQLAEAAGSPYRKAGIWLNSDKCTCEQLTRKGKKAEVILGSFNAG